MEKLKKLENLLAQGKITRREFLTRVSVIGLTAALSPALLNTSTHAATPKKGDGPPCLGQVQPPWPLRCGWF